jgi:hypothetical protein
MAAALEVMMDDIQTRDKRRINHMDPETKQVHLRLEAWGAWAKESEIRAWPSITILGRMMEQGSGAGQQGRPPISMPEEISQVDAAVCKLGDIDRRAVKLYYIKWAPIEIHARALKMRPRQFQNVLRRARWRLALVLGAL